MRQDTDVARMAAALRTPSLKYRSFGNDPVRTPPVAPAASGEQDFSILGDALAGASDLPPDAVLHDPAPLAPAIPTETPMLATRDVHAPRPEPVPPETSVYEPPASYPIAPDPYVELHRVAAPVVPPLPDVAPVQDMVSPAVAPQVAVRQPASVPASVPMSSPLPLTQEPAGQSLLQVLLGGQLPPQTIASAPPPVLPVASPTPREMQPVAAEPTPASPPMAPQAPAMSMLSSLASGPAAWSGGRSGAGTGSSLLDALMGFGPGAGSASIHYPLLDALGDAMRGTTAEPSPRHWPAARVDIALPELLRRVAAGARFARNAA
jgi:hypothetical protein